MKTTYTEQQIQAAIDAALIKTEAEHSEIDGSFSADPLSLPEYWKKEFNARLQLAKAFLEKLEADPYAEFRKADAEGKVIQYKGAGKSWIDLDLGTNDPLFGYFSPTYYRIKPEPEPDTFEAHGKTWTRHTPGDPMPCDGEAVINWILPSEINDGYGDQEMKAVKLDWRFPVGWRYADAPQANPVSDQTQVAWTPAVGDVVRLKSGGPMMTIATFTPENAAICYWFNESERDSATFPTACLTKEDVQ
jgi:uncharacterized protein YodC (DUF2158 family)